tara:strand:+ start:121 stop:276 length:156 start_codon:yes stop_codon:yes gene_type:complete
MSKIALIENDHLREKLEFALALSESIGDKKRSAILKDQIKKIGFTSEEPGL